MPNIQAVSDTLRKNQKLPSKTNNTNIFLEILKSDILTYLIGILNAFKVHG